MTCSVAFKLIPEPFNTWKNIACRSLWLTAVELEVNPRPQFSLDDFNQVMKMVLELEISESVSEKCSTQATEYSISFTYSPFSQTGDEGKSC